MKVSPEVGRLRRERPISRRLRRSRRRSSDRAGTGTTSWPRHTPGDACTSGVNVQLFADDATATWSESTIQWRVDSESVISCFGSAAGPEWWGAGSARTGPDLSGIGSEDADIGSGDEGVPSDSVLDITCGPRD